MAARRLDPARWMTARYSIALIVIALSACTGFLMAERIIGQHEHMLEVVNVSGRQRMLSQRAALLVERLLRVQTPEERAGLTRRLGAAADMFELAHRRLAGSLPIAAEDAATLDDAVFDYVAALRAIAAAPDGLSPDRPEVRHVISMALGPLLDQLEEMVALRQKEGEAVFVMLHRLEAALLALMLVTLVAEVLLIFRPMVRKVQAQFAENAAMTRQLEQARDTLEAQVRARTEELQAAKEAAEQANHAKSRFLAHAGHDLKQPLEVIGMYTGMLERLLPDARGRPLIRDLRAAQRSMRDLLDSILEISRLEAGVVEPAVVAVPLGPMLDRLGGEFVTLADAKTLSCRVVATTAVVRTDPVLLTRILRNFLSNAVRYTESGGILLGCRRRGDLLRIEVHDTGRGIAATDRQRIFEEFIQLAGPDRDRSEGIGLGLAIADRLARLLGHALDLRSTEGRGSVFAVTVPLVAHAGVRSSLEYSQ